MNAFEEKDFCELVSIDDDKDFRDFLKSTPRGLAFLPERYGGCNGLVMKADAGDFAKWLRQNKPDLNVELRTADRRLDLRSADFWLPLALLANDVAIQFYLNLVANYVYDRMRGALQGERARVHLEVIYEDKQEGLAKRFRYAGDLDGLQKVIKRFDLDKFMDK